MAGEVVSKTNYMCSLIWRKTKKKLEKIIPSVSVAILLKIYYSQKYNFPRVDTTENHYKYILIT